jgi:hypothetical protein
VEGDVDALLIRLTDGHTEGDDEGLLSNGRLEDMSIRKEGKCEFWRFWGLFWHHFHHRFSLRAAWNYFFLVPILIMSMKPHRERASS